MEGGTGSVKEVSVSRNLMAFDHIHCNNGNL